MWTCFFSTATARSSFFKLAQTPKLCHLNVHPQEIQTCCRAAIEQVGWQRFGRAVPPGRARGFPVSEQPGIHGWSALVEGPELVEGYLLQPAIFRDCVMHGRGSVQLSGVCRSMGFGTLWHAMRCYHLTTL